MVYMIGYIYGIIHLSGSTGKKPLEEAPLGALFQAQKKPHQPKPVEM